MYYICEWDSNYIVFDDNTKRLADESAKEIFNAICNFKEDAWDTTSQPWRNIHIANNYLFDEDTPHKVIFQLPHLDITEKSHPELFI